MTEAELWSSRVALYRDDFVRYVTDVIGVVPTAQQIAVMRALEKPGAKVSVKAAHGVGKSALASWGALWFLPFRTEAKIPCTAPSSNQMFDVLWSEMSLWHSKMIPYFKRELVLKSDRLEKVGCERQCYAAARTARRENPQALQGFHSQNLLIVVDEANGVDDAIYEVLEGAMTNPDKDRILLIGNPIVPQGYFFKTHTKWRDQWQCFTLDCDGCSFPGAKRYEEIMRLKYGVEHPLYIAKVKGEFPINADNVLIPLGWLEGALRRDLKEVGGKRIAGLDVARYGDDATALVVRAGSVVTHIDQWRNLDLMKTVGKVVTAYRDAKLFDMVCVDVIGLGSGVFDRLKEQNIPCVAVNVAESSSSSERFMRLRDELWWKTREWFESQTVKIEPKLPLAEDLVAELCDIRYELTSAGKIKIESKDEMKSRGKVSPNLSDAICLGFSAPVGYGANGTFTMPKLEVGSAVGWT